MFSAFDMVNVVPQTILGDILILFMEKIKLKSKIELIDFSHESDKEEDLELDLEKNVDGKNSNRENNELFKKKIKEKEKNFQKKKKIKGSPTLNIIEEENEIISIKESLSKLNEKFQIDKKPTLLQNLSLSLPQSLNFQKFGYLNFEEKINSLYIFNLSNIYQIQNLFRLSNRNINLINKEKNLNEEFYINKILDIFYQCKNDIEIEKYLKGVYTCEFYSQKTNQIAIIKNPVLLHFANARFEAQLQECRTSYMYQKLKNIYHQNNGTKKFPISPKTIWERIERGFDLEKLTQKQRKKRRKKITAHFGYKLNLKEYNELINIFMSDVNHTVLCKLNDSYKLLYIEKTIQMFREYYIEKNNDN
ncbi:hypothetical protein M0813_23145 [Anaeramoeba flamelloides]|uniref:Uncharacterized protein n=1 Tax=Anaeramoeba flamelloides TaxID=1746091 RepID=A0ABQ8Y9P8_9EUKA|nr:hypothetical protein M0813_23145 [Anaeramoeba flamelloides]